MAQVDFSVQNPPRTLAKVCPSCPESVKVTGWMGGWGWLVEAKMEKKHVVFFVQVNIGWFVVRGLLNIKYIYYI